MQDCSIFTANTLQILQSCNHRVNPPSVSPVYIYINIWSPNNLGITVPADVLAHNIVRASAETLLIQNLPWLFLISISVVIQRQNGHLLEKRISFCLIQMLQKMVPKSPPNNQSVWGQLLTWWCTSGKPVPEPTRTTITPAFWGYPLPPHDYPYYWVILDLKSKEDKVKVTNLKNSPKFLNFETNITCNTPSEVAW